MASEYRKRSKHFHFLLFLPLLVFKLVFRTNLRSLPRHRCVLLTNNEWPGILLPKKAFPIRNHCLLQYIVGQKDTTMAEIIAKLNQQFFLAVIVKPQSTNRHFKKNFKAKEKYLLKKIAKPNSCAYICNRLAS